MKIICCNRKCGKEYLLEDNVYSSDKANRPILQCPHCGLKHLLDFIPFDKDIRLKKAKKLTLTTIYYVDVTASRIANANREDQSGSDDNPVINWTKTNPFIIGIQVGTSKGPIARQYKLQVKDITDDDAWQDIGSTGEIKWALVADTVLGDGTTLTSGNKLCTGTPEPNWQDGLESEEDNLLPDSGTYSLTDEYYSEFQWGLKSNDAEDAHEYAIRLFDVTQGASVGEALAHITMASAGVTVSPTPVSAISATLIGAIVLGSLALSPNPAVVIGEGVNPTVIKGSLLLSPSPVEAVGTAIDPTVVISSEGELVTPDPVSAVGAVVDPGVKLGSTTVTPNPATVIGITIDPTVIKGPLTIIPDPASCVAATVDPTVIKGPLVIIPSPVSSIGATVDPVVIVSGGIIVSPSPASAIGVATDPNVIVTVFIGDVPAPGIRLNMRASVIAHVPSIKLNIKGS